MIGAIVLTFVITSLGMIALFLLREQRRQGHECERIGIENDHLRQQLSELFQKEQSRRENAAYNQGLYNGRETDTLYRSILNRYTRGEQATIMMHGEQSRSST